MVFLIFLQSIFFSNVFLEMHHPYRVSVTNIELDTLQHKIDYSIRMFSDDLQHSLRHFYERDLYITDSISHENKELVIKYVNTGFGILIDGTKLNLECTDIKIQDNSTWLYYQGLLPEKRTTKIKLINRMFLDMFLDQTNLTIFSVGEIQKGYTFNYLTQEVEIDLNSLTKSDLENQ